MTLQTFWLQIVQKRSFAERFLLAAAIEPFEGHPLGDAVKAGDCPRVAANPVVLIMARQFGIQDRLPTTQLRIPHNLVNTSDRLEYLTIAMLLVSFIVGIPAV
jgi:hypothetical protein